MNLLELEYFLVAAEELNFTRAAERLYITQQALSRHINNLEDYFGCQLFDRSRPMSLTKEGVGLQRAGKHLLSTVTDVEREIRDIKDMRNGELIIGITRARGKIYLPNAIQKFNQEFPNIKITIIEGNSSEVEDALHNAKIDLMIGFTPLESQDVTSIALCQEHSMLAVPCNLIQQYYLSDYNKIISGEKHLTLKELEHFPFLALDMTTRAGRDFCHYCSEAGFTPKVIATAKNLSSLIPICLQGVGVLFCSEIFFLPYKGQFGPPNEPTIKFFPVDDISPPQNICVNYLKSKYLSFAAKSLISHLEAALAPSLRTE